MCIRLLPWLTMSILTLALMTPSHAANEPSGIEQIYSQCHTTSAGSQFRYHRCLVGEYELLIKKSDLQTDKLLGLVGAYRPFGRMRIIQWSNAILKSQSRWLKLIVWDCEWPGHLSLELKGAAAAMTECRIDRAMKRVQLLDKRIQAINTVVANEKKKEK